MLLFFIGAKPIGEHERAYTRRSAVVPAYGGDTGEGTDGV